LIDYLYTFKYVVLIIYTCGLIRHIY